MTDSKDWQKEYTNLLEEYDTAVRNHKDMGSLLCRTLSKLATATSGLDPSLDPHLDTLRQAVRSGADPSLTPHLKQFANDLLKITRRPRASTNKPSSDQLSSKLVKLSSLQGKQADQFKKLTDRLLIDPDSLSDGEFCTWLTAICPEGKRETANAPGFVARLFGGSKKADADLQQAAINPLLRDLLEKLQWPEQWKQDIESLCLHLAESTKRDEWKAVIESISVLAYHTFGIAKEEIDEAEDFLEELTQRLRDLDSHLQTNHTNRESTLESGRELNKFVTNQVENIGESIDRSSDLQTLKRNIRQTLDTIQEHVEDFTKEEEVRYEQGEDNDLKLKQRLAELENETEELRAKMLEAHHLALQDSVTGLPNRTAYEERMGQEFIRWKRFGEPLSMLVWDIDDFKMVNDRFGHQAGDKALRVIAKTLQNRLRESDFIARYGGEEFVCLLSGTDKEAALKVAEEMRLSIANSGFHTGSKAIVLTASCGISAFCDNDTPARVFARADKALYKAKESGKNCCTIL